MFGDFVGFPWELHASLRLERRGKDGKNTMKSKKCLLMATVAASALAAISGVPVALAASNAPMMVAQASGGNLDALKRAVNEAEAALAKARSSGGNVAAAQGKLTAAQNRLRAAEKTQGNEKTSGDADRGRGAAGTPDKSRPSAAAPDDRRGRSANQGRADRASPPAGAAKPDQDKATPSAPDRADDQRKGRTPSHGQADRAQPPPAAKPGQDMRTPPATGRADDQRGNQGRGPNQGEADRMPPPASAAKPGQDKATPPATGRAEDRRNQGRTPGQGEADRTPPPPAGVKPGQDTRTPPATGRAEDRRNQGRTPGQGEADRTLPPPAGAKPGQDTRTPPATGRADDQRDQGRTPSPGQAERAQPPAGGSRPGTDDATRRAGAPGVDRPDGRQPDSRASQVLPTRREGERVEDGEVLRTAPGRLIIRTPQNELTIRSDDNERFRRSARDVNVDRVGGGFTRTVVVRQDGSRLVTVRDQDGNVAARYRENGPSRDRVYFIGAPEDFDRQGNFREDRWRERNVVDRGRDGDRFAFERRLPPLRVGIPREEYVVEINHADPRRVRETLIAPPVERAERSYTLEEVRRSERLRDKVRRIDLDTITFETGSADVMPDQIGTLDMVGQAIADIVRQNPAEVYLIEGHTDAVGQELANLELSDRRAESVAAVLSEHYGIPPENLVTQGYGEEQLKVPTDGPERLNRRVTLRRITPLLHAQN
jgi:outer membrane protein OmpA-like peptidoglycan-associated protein